MGRNYWHNLSKKSAAICIPMLLFGLDLKIRQGDRWADLLAGCSCTWYSCVCSRKHTIIAALSVKADRAMKVIFLLFDTNWTAFNPIIDVVGAQTCCIRYSVLRSCLAGPLAY